VDPFPDPLLLRKSGSAGNLTRKSGSVAITEMYFTFRDVQSFKFDRNLAFNKRFLIRAGKYILINHCNFDKYSPGKFKEFTDEIC
jgi:hypothetical protein